MLGIFPQWRKIARSLEYNVDLKTMQKRKTKGKTKDQTNIYAMCKRDHIYFSTHTKCGVET